MSLQQLLCRHTRVELVRAHPESDFACRHPGRVSYVDDRGVNNYVRCVHCGFVLEVEKPRERIFGSIPE